MIIPVKCVGPVCKSDRNNTRSLKQITHVQSTPSILDQQGGGDGSFFLTGELDPRKISPYTIDNSFPSAKMKHESWVWLCPTLVDGINQYYDYNLRFRHLQTTEIAHWIVATTSLKPKLCIYNYCTYDWLRGPWCVDYYHVVITCLSPNLWDKQSLFPFVSGVARLPYGHLALHPKVAGCDHGVAGRKTT